jgi:hypothetical protein
MWRGCGEGEVNQHAKHLPTLTRNHLNTKNSVFLNTASLNFRTKTMKNLLLAFIALYSIYTQAQGIKGTVKDADGEVLPFASIYIKEAGTGTSSNVNGYYELRLPPGTYQVTYQFLGFAAQTKTVVVGSSFKTLDVVLQPQSMVLNTVTITADAEDPAYTIMRKAIAKSKFHLLQTNRYTAQVYTKGTGQLKNIPWAFRKQLEKEGIDTSRAFTSESVSEITFERPNTFKEKILSIRTSGQNDQNASPNGYINSSFYLPMVVESVSPLSPKAFAYYRFALVGTFEDRGVEINKIKVTPRSRGEQVFEGYIYIRENFWNIHSLDLSTTVQGFDLKIEQIFGPIVQDIWMPVTQKYQFSGSFFGFDVVYDYLASVSNYQVEPNTDLSPDLVVIDEKIEPVPENQKEQTTTENLKKDEKPLTRKELMKLVEEYEGQEETKEDKNVVSDYWYDVDSTARKKDSTYWDAVRPVPLTEKEKEGYKVTDSVYVAEQADSAKKENGSAISFGDVFFGNTYKLGENARFKFNGFLPEFRYNSVEGFNLDFAGTLRWKNDTTLGLRISPNVRYGFSSGRLYGKLNASFGFGKYPHRSSFEVEGGSYINQFNPEAIDPLVNSLWTLFFARNYMKLFEQQYVNVFFNQQFNYGYTLVAGVGYAQRSELFNSTNFTFFRNGENWFTPNAPVNTELAAGTGGFENANALKTNLTFYAKPWLKFRRYNGKKIPLENSSPQFRATWRSGWDALDSDVNYQNIELGFTGEFKLGVKATIDFNAEAGTFLSNSAMLFVDFKHFNGGLTEIAPLTLTNNYRLLDYYRYSTQTSYASLFTHIRFRKFLFTHIPLVRLSGVKENLFVNYLKTEVSPHYIEVGYTIDQIFRLFRLEFVQSFNGIEPYQFGVRIGVSTLFNQ